MGAERQSEEYVRDLPCWQGPVAVEVLKGGVSNTSFKVTDASGSYVARLGYDYPFHQVFRDTELAASVAAYEAGLSPAVVYTEPGVMVVRFLKAKTYSEADVRANAGRCVDIIKRCHRDMGRRVRGRLGFFWVFQVIRAYLRTLEEAGQPMPPRSAKWASVVDRMEAAQEPLPIVFGHHDLLPANFMDDGKRLWLIDWEYSGFGTAMFDLANLSANNQFGDGEDDALLEAYFERKPSEAMARSFHAMKCASALREGIWGMVSELKLSESGIDYGKYAEEHLGRYARCLASFDERYGTA